MLSLRGVAVAPALALFVAACGDGTGPAPLATVECADASTIQLAAGKLKVFDPNELGSCVRFPAAGGGGAEYLYTAVATEGTETPSGVEDDYQLDGGAAGSLGGATASVAMPNPMLSAFRPRLRSTAFHHRLRVRERELSMRRGRGLGAGPGPDFRVGAQSAISAAITKPTVNSSRQFFVCGTPDCNDDEFVQVTATAKHVGDRVAIYVDDAAPASGYTQTDLDNVGALFDDYLYPIDTMAFGRESDIDSNGVVIVLLTPRVNALSDDCNTSVILGYFFGLDLLSAEPKSNDGEVFYGIVPDPTNSSCAVTTSYANRNLPPTFIHEFQHMISFNQHVLVRNAVQEDVWLNEGLSHYAEELGARQIPDAKCINNSCINQFAIGDLVNAYNYLHDVESQYLVAPGSSGGTLEERGAGWLFVRWLGDQYGDNVLATNVTRQLVQTSLTGAANVEHAVDEPFSNLVPLWQLANYTDDLSLPAGSSTALQYPSWNFRAGFSSFHTQDPTQFPTTYPLVPDPVTTSSYGRAGILRAGSGPHTLITQPAGGGAVDLRLTAGDGISLPPAAVKPRIAIVRIR